MAKKKDRTGEVGVNNNGEEMTIVRYGKYDDIDIQFDNGVIVEHRKYDDFKKGEIKNPFFPIAFGVGYMGIGKFKSRDKNGKPTKCYNAWHNMLKRCYYFNYQEKNTTYANCTVCKEWHDFQVFAEWYYSHFYEIENEMMTLDKDILHKGNKVYSPETCVFVPQSINKLFTKRDTVRGKYPIGVCKMGNKFIAYLCKGNGKQISLGYYATPNEAFLAYKHAKEKYIKEVAEEYKLYIPQKLYDAMIVYEVEIDD